MNGRGRGEKEGKRREKRPETRGLRQERLERAHRFCHINIGDLLKTVKVGHPGEVLLEEAEAALFATAVNVSAASVCLSYLPYHAGL